MLRDNAEVRVRSPRGKKELATSWAFFPELSGMLQLHFFSLSPTHKNRPFPAQNRGQRVREKDRKRKNAGPELRLLGAKKLLCWYLCRHVKHGSVSFPSVAALPLQETLQTIADNQVFWK